MKTFLWLILGFLTLNVFAQSNTEKFKEAVNSFTSDSDLANAYIGICIKELPSNQTIIDYQATKNLIPASLQKIFLTAIALEKFGSNYTFKTFILSSGILQDSILIGNVYLIGGGDPTLGSIRFKETHPDSVFLRWYQAIKKKGIKSIQGNIYIDPSIFNAYPLNDTWMWGDVGNYYGAGVKGLNWHENMFVVSMKPADSLSKTALLTDIYPLFPPEFTVNNQVKTVKKGSESYLSIYGDSYSRQREVCGTIALDKPLITAKGAMAYPEYVCAWSFKNYLSHQGIFVADSIYYADVDTMHLSFDTLYINTSLKLSVIINHINKTSNNIYAEALYKLLGKGSSQNAALEIQKGVQNMGIEVSRIRIADGCGLSPVNLISPAALCDVLAYVSTKDYYLTYIQSLSEAGVSGTLKNVLKNKPRTSNIYAKSGTMTGVRGYAGYLINADGNTYCFAIMVNNYTCESVIVKKKIEKLMLSLME